jgi:hypothetical protein
MATVVSNTLTIFDAAKMYSKDGKFLTRAELLAKKIGLHKDFEWIEGDASDTHMSRQSTSLPDVYDKVHNEGVPASKGTSAQVEEKYGALEGWSKFQESIGKSFGPVADKKADQDEQFVESIRQSWANRTLYGNPNTSNGSQVDGIMRRYGTKSGNPFGRNVLLAKDAASGGDYTSILLIGHGRGKVAAWYPKGTPAGLQVEDFPREHMTIKDANDVEREVVQYPTRYYWAWGLAIDNPYYIVRIANCDLSDLAGATPPDVILLMQQALSLLPDRSACRPAFYVSGTMDFWLQRALYLGVKAGAGGLGMMNVAGEQMMGFQNVPINRLEEISENETRVQ